MKKLLYIAMAFTLSSTAFAFSEKSDWSEIRKNKRINIVQPKFAEAFGRTGLFNACVTEDEIKSINPVNVCLDLRDVQKGVNTEAGTYIVTVCNKSAIQEVVVSKTHTQVVCTKHVLPTETSSNECIEWGSITSTYPESYSIEIVRANKLETGNHLFNKTLALPTCE
jgi:hypothetical protein